LRWILSADIISHRGINSVSTAPVGGLAKSFFGGHNFSLLFAYADDHRRSTRRFVRAALGFQRNRKVLGLDTRWRQLLILVTVTPPDRNLPGMR
jgi:hypothetical protein